MRFDVILEAGLFFSTFIVNNAHAIGHELYECEWYPEPFSMQQALHKLSKYHVYAHYQAIL